VIRQTDWQDTEDQRWIIFPPEILVNNEQQNEEADDQRSLRHQVRRFGG
jgi:hypothetical protein